MNQRMQDLLLLLRQEKKYQVLVALGLVAILYVTFSDSAPQRHRAKPDTGTKEIALGDKEAFRDLVSTVGAELDSLKSTQQETTKQLSDIRTNIDNDRAQVAEIFKKMLERMETQSVGGAGAMPAVGGSYSMQTNPDAMAVSMSGGMESVDALASFGDTTEPAIAPPAPPAPKRSAVIMPGDSVRVKLLAGVNAPTDGTPYPVVFKLVSNVEGPDASNLPLGEARIVAAAQGSLTDSRVLFRLTTMNVRLPSGQKKEVPIDGWVVGEDGIRGMEGILIDPIGKAIAGSMQAGFIAGVGQGFAARETSSERSFWGGPETVVSGDPLKYAFGKGVQGGANEVAGLIKERAALMVPHVAAYSGREATAVFSKTVVIEDLLESLQETDNGFAASVD